MWESVDGFELGMAACRCKTAPRSSLLRQHLRMGLKLGKCLAHNRQQQMLRLANCRN